MRAAELTRCRGAKHSLALRSLSALGLAQSAIRTHWSEYMVASQSMRRAMGATHSARARPPASAAASDCMPGTRALSYRVTRLCLLRRCSPAAARVIIARQSRHLPQPLPCSLQVVAQRRQLALEGLPPDDLDHQCLREERGEREVYETSAQFGELQRAPATACPPAHTPLRPSAALPARTRPSGRGPPCRGWRWQGPAPRHPTGGERIA